jgi:hypothetical protein
MYSRLTQLNSISGVSGIDGSYQYVIKHLTQNCDCNYSNINGNIYNTKKTYATARQFLYYNQACDCNGYDIKQNGYPNYGLKSDIYSGYKDKCNQATGVNWAYLLLTKFCSIRLF